MAHPAPTKGRCARPAAHAHSLGRIRVVWTSPWTHDTSADVHDPVELAATLRDGPTDTPIADEIVTRNLAGRSCLAPTDAQGRASCLVTPDSAPGSFTAEASGILEGIEKRIVLGLHRLAVY